MTETIPGKKPKKFSYSGAGVPGQQPQDKPNVDGAIVRPVTAGPSLGLSGSAEKRQAIYIELPITKRKIECSHSYLDPDKCFASPLNKRIQTLLTEDNVDIIKLRESIEAEGQRDPVLARPVTIDGEIHYEIVYGTRRRYVMSLLAKHASEPVKLRAWVSANIPDVDAKRLATSENDDRAGISAWENAQYIKAQSATKPVEVIADEMGMSAPAVYRHLAIADLPECVVSVFESPALVTLTSGVAIASAIKKISNEQLSSLLLGFESHRATSAPEFLKALRSVVVSPIRLASRKTEEWKSKTGKSSVSLTRHRTKEGSFSASFDGVSDDVMTKIIASVRAMLP